MVRACAKVVAAKAEAEHELVWADGDWLGVLAVTGASIVLMALHDVLFGWVTRCGAGLPLALVLVFLVALTYERAKAWLAAGLSALLAFAVVVVDATTGPNVIGLVLPVMLIVFGIGWAVRRRVELNRELKARDAELRRLREERAALVITDDRARLSQQLDGLLQERLAQLTTAAESADGLAPQQAKALLESIETDSRRTLDDMREIVALLRGGDAALAPTPSVAHLDALLAQHQSAHARLTVTGNLGSLPASVELSAYRIVEYLIAALADQPDAPIAVAVRFDETALEIHVTGPVSKSAEVKEIIARANERSGPGPAGLRRHRGVRPAGAGRLAAAGGSARRDGGRRIRSDPDRGGRDQSRPQRAGRIVPVRRRP